MHAGAGYQYLLRSVATNDAYDEAVEENNLAGYYRAKGTPPGRWLGHGVAALQSETAISGAEITADQMACLWGEGLHPDAINRMENGEKIDACQLGRRFPTYTGGDKALEALREAENEFRKTHRRLPTEAERSELVVDTCRPFFEDETGQINASGEHIVNWVNKRRESVKQAVAGYDFTFSPAKSVSVLWALADKDTANLIAACHHEAVEEAIAWAESHVVRTRKGYGGIAQVGTSGLIAAQFTHFDTRTGDPDLHTHVLLSNKVLREDGKWTSLDGQPLFMHHHNISTRYDKLLMDKLRARLGVDFEERRHENTMQPTWEISTISDDLVFTFSQRRRNAKPVFDELVEAFTEKYGRAPSKRQTKELWQKAILDTRDAKKPAESLDELRSRWSMAALNNELGAQFAREIAATVAAETPANERLRAPDRGGDTYAEWVDRVARDAVERVTDRRSEMRFHHLETAVTSGLKGYTFADAEDFEKVHSDICRHMYANLCVNIRPNDDVLELPSELTRGGKAIDYRIGQERFTTQAILDAENHVLQATRELTPHIARNATIENVLAQHEKDHGWSLNQGQEALARHLLSTGTLVATGVGPAGTGKTTSMEVVANVWKAEGHRVIGLAPSAQAASVLGREIGVKATTIDRLTHTWMGRNPSKPGHSLRALPIKISRGDMLLVDEAGMASTKNLAAVVEIAEKAGAIVRFIGDPQQLDAVESGGLFGTLTRMAPTAELTDVMRFSQGNDTEQSEASLKLRRGDTSAAEFYTERGWVTGGTREQMLTDAVDAYIADTERGLSSLVVASTNEDVNHMNAIIRQHRIEAGLVDDSTEAQLSRGDTAGVGDIIITRENKVFPLKQKVMNGQLWTVRKILPGGSLLVTDTKSGRPMVLPADYVQSNTHLGYAATVHRSQGATVDTTHAVIDGRVDRAGLYVALTRGKMSNRVYAVVEPRFDEDAEDQHYHMAGDEQAPTARDVFVSAIRRDRRQRSALDAVEEEIENVTGRKRVERLYRYARELTTNAYVETVAPAFIDHLPGIDADGENQLRTTLTRLIDAGIDPANALTEATSHLEGANNPTAVVCWRLHKLIPSEKQPYAPLPRAATWEVSRELKEWMAATRDRLSLPPSKEKPKARGLQAFTPTTAEELKQQLRKQSARPGARTEYAAPTRKKPTRKRGLSR